MMDKASVDTGNASEQFLHINSCSHCTGATFETEKKPIRYSVNLACDTFKLPMVPLFLEAFNLKIIS